MKNLKQNYIKKPINKFGGINNDLKLQNMKLNNFCKRQGFTFDFIKQMFEIMPNSKTYTFTVEKERQYAIKVLNVISNLKQKERDRVLQELNQSIGGLNGKTYSYKWDITIFNFFQ